MSIIKKVEKPLYLLKLEALLGRLPNHHPKRAIVIEEAAKVTAGFRGEQSIEYSLKEVQHQVSIFNDLRLQSSSGSFFQLDFLILTPYFIALIESKNYIGAIRIQTDHRQMIRTFEGKETVFPDAVLQLRRQTRHLTDWMHDHSIVPIPIPSFVGIANPTTRFDVSPPHPDYLHRFIRAIELPDTIHSLLQKNKTVFLKADQLRKFERMLLKNHVVYDPDLLAKFKIEESSLLKGVQCPNCAQFSMERMSQRWHCPACNAFSKEAHIQAIQDYAYLIKPTASSVEIARFLMLDSRFTAYRMLISMNLKTSGGPKNRIYYLR
ncbi:NERD domain-containing protein [Domibacillus mangrovi]|uniref:NERD domain-containing protein n=1 Tax=Domibacillus mangrovi TaxID=1714354 RepID=A0A1Q5P2G8_9BACI|nr:NERD domain-containing protein [Domibacillus mangrovi]OKL36361.1 hypothetical protein BLL40_10725 [Domibacillus mangrovi]